MLDVDVNNTASGDAKKALQTILRAMDLKSSDLRNLEIATQEDARKFFDSVFYMKKHFSSVISSTPLPKIGEALDHLKGKDIDYFEAVDFFANNIRGAERADIEDMAKETIHFLHPEKFPLWTRWIWNKERGTGSINYSLKDDVKISNPSELFAAIDELKKVLEVFGAGNYPNYYLVSIFLVYSYVRYLDYTTHLAVDKRAAGLVPTHLTTTALVLGLKPYLKVIRLANS
ncbi:MULTISPECIES: hypothetical protein [Acidianus]|uniref:Uncharacterized protein n=1 Tax=Candidatus Acidianus copahuensis TaxID=1160895 RepID=A0A031LPV1_9CREN|nr:MULTISPECIES: hypothetical protein [Acidianus]EZQ07036.1 hypothetical protein CM19_06675 [Candidatus Acidianus copahuensis]NON62908.1 hypothetical protein [Acidianus sp. RZ1]